MGAMRGTISLFATLMVLHTMSGSALTTQADIERLCSFPEPECYSAQRAICCEMSPKQSAWRTETSCGCSRASETIPQTHIDRNCNDAGPPACLSTMKGKCCSMSPKQQVVAIAGECECRSADGAGANVITVGVESTDASSSSPSSPSPVWPPSSLKGKCLDAVCDNQKAMAEPAMQQMMVQQMRLMSPDVPECCFQSVGKSGMFPGVSCPAVPTVPPAAAPTSCMGNPTPLTAGMSVEMQCIPPDGDYSRMYSNGGSGGCYQGGKCASPCAMQGVAIDSTHMMLGIVSNKDGSTLTEQDFTQLVHKMSCLQDDVCQNYVSMNYVLKMSCSAMMSRTMSSQSTEQCPEIGQFVCSSTTRPVLVQLIQSQDAMMKLEQSGECDFGMTTVGSDSCAMLTLNPTKMLYFLCGSTSVGSDLPKQYCGDWISNPDGQCSAEKGQYESCSLTNGPVNIKESECAGNAFLQKFVRGSNDNPHCGPLLRGGCCVASMFFAFTDSDEVSMWPLCVRSWATQTCGVDLSMPCSNSEVEQTLVVEFSMTLDMASGNRRLGNTTVSSCTNIEAKLLSGKISAALAKTSAAASTAGARPIVVSDSSCLGGGEQSRKIVADVVIQGSDADARHALVAAAVSSPDFPSRLRAEGVEATQISIKAPVQGASTTSIAAAGAPSGSADPISGAVAPRAVATAALVALMWSGRCHA